MTPNEQLLKTAIETKSCVRGIYEGRERYFCPHVLGKKGVTSNVLVYQYAGRTSKGPITTPPDPANGPSDNWRCLHVEQLSELSLVDGPWYTCQKHTEPSTCVNTIIAQVTH